MTYTWKEMVAFFAVWAFIMWQIWGAIANSAGM